MGALDGRTAIVTGLEVLEAMQSVPVGAQDRPKDPPVITSVTITEHAA